MTQGLDFAGLIADLTTPAHVQHQSFRGDLQRKYRAELAALLVILRKASIVGRNGRPADPAEKCDACGTDLEDAGLYVDSKIDHTPGWANFCMDCYVENGSGIGFGLGQLYRHDGRGWQCIGGGDPTPPEDDEGEDGW